jgi:Protein of unknown function (DUF4058)
MRSPFPGMDPYLEDPIFWSSFHNRFLVAIADAITPHIIPKYYVEIDFLRTGKPMTMGGATGEMDYHILVSRSNLRPSADLYAFTIQESIPDFPLPLQSDDEDLLVNLQEISEGVYDRSAYSLRLNYTDPVPPPALSKTDLSWIQELLQP